MKNKRSHAYYLLLFLLTLLFLAIVFLFSLKWGAADLSFADINRALFDFDRTNQAQQVFRTIRLPRVLGTALVGASFAIAGAMMQGITRNPLADTGLLGINAGAGLGLAVCFALLPHAGYFSILGASFIGAALGVASIYAIAFSNPFASSPLRLILAGAGISALFVALSQMISLLFNLNRDLAFWTLGGTSVITWTQVAILAPTFVVLLLISLTLGKAITLIHISEETAVNLGLNPSRIRVIVSLLVLGLAGVSVSIVGSIGFVGLMVPHIMSFFVGSDYRYILPFSAVGGAILLTAADLAARMINPPFETPSGAVVALLGVPFFLLMARGREVAS